VSVVPYRVKWAIALGDRFELDPDDLSGSDADEHGDQLERPFGGLEEHFVSDDDEYYDDVEDDFFDENVDPNVNETREQRHTRRMRQAKEKLAREIDKEVKVNDTTWKVVSEHHRDPTPDTVGKPEVVGFDFNDFNLLRLFRHMYPGLPEEDIERANSFMAQKYSEWQTITTREWFLWHGLFIAAALYGQQVRRVFLHIPAWVFLQSVTRAIRTMRQRASADVGSFPRDARRAKRCGPRKPSGWSRRRTSDNTACRTSGSRTSSRPPRTANRRTTRCR